MPSSPAQTTRPLFPRASLHAAVLAWADRNAANNAAPWCVAFSGGADSLALLITLREHYPQHKLVALHFNHHLRGDASDGDEKFCREMCAALGLEIRVGHWKHNNASTSEAAAREARHAFFAAEMSALTSLAIWLGHQLDDIAETQLMRLARGSSTAGLAAPRPVHTRADGRTFLRPLLTLSKNKITSALRARDITWREDATNAAIATDIDAASGDYFRNRIRRSVLPEWIAAAENDALAGAALTRELLDEDATALDAWLDELLPPQSSAGILPASNAPLAGETPAPLFGSQILDLRPLANKPRALLRRALRRWPPAAELARAGFEALIAICETPNGGRTSIGDFVAVFENGILRLSPVPTDASSAHALINAPPFQPFSFSALQPFFVTLPDGSSLTAEIVALTDELRARIFAGEFDPINTIFITPLLENSPDLNTFSVRTWQPGDRYQPLGAPGSAKLSDLFINHKIPHARRLTLPVICAQSPAGDQIIWVPGLPPANEWKITTKTPQALRLTYLSGTCTVRR